MLLQRCSVPGLQVEFLTVQQLSDAGISQNTARKIRGIASRTISGGMKAVSSIQPAFAIPSRCAGFSAGFESGKILFGGYMSNKRSGTLQYR